MSIYADQAERLIAESGADADPRSVELVRVAEKKLTEVRKGPLARAQQHSESLRVRAIELNRKATELPPQQRIKENALLDEYILGQPPFGEYAEMYDRFRSEKKFVVDSLQRVVEVLQPFAIREVLAARLDEKKAEYEVAKSQAIFSLVRRNLLIQPAVEHELAIEVKGGISQEAQDLANRCLLEVGQQERELRDYDQSLRARGLEVQK